MYKRQVARANSIYQNLSHSITVLTLLSPLVVWALLRYGRAGMVMAITWIILLLAIAVIGRLFVGLVAAIASTLFMILAGRFPKFSVDLVIALCILSIILAPFVGYGMKYVSPETKAAISDSWEHRVEMWAYVGRLIAENPVLGYGFDAVRTFDETYTGMGYEQTKVSLHPHNTGLHIWSETGAVGAGLACLVLFFLRQSLQNYISASKSRAIMVVGFLGAALAICTFTYGVWQEWWWGVLILIGGFISMLEMNAKSVSYTHLTLPTTSRV